METNKKTARIVGILFIIGTAAGVLSLFGASIVNAEDYLTKISENTTKVILGVMFQLIMGISLAMIPALLYPIFKKHNETLALGAVVFRGALEMMAYMGIAISWLLLLTLSQNYVGEGTPAASDYQLMGTMLLDVGHKFSFMLDIVFSIGALFIYWLFFKTKLIPVWLSLWGIIGAILYLSYPILFIFGVDVGILQIPLAIQEMILAIWLIIKGFNPVVKNLKQL